MGTSNRVVLAGFLFLTACAHQVNEPASDSTGTSSAIRHADSIEQRQQLARRLRASGDLAAAASQWQILTILAPNDRQFRQELESTRTALSKAATESFDKGIAALKSGNTDEAAQLMLRVLALQPDHEIAAATLRKIETERIGRIQVAKANRAKKDSESAQKNGEEAAYSDIAEYRRSYDIEQTIELFLAGDSEGGLRELSRYLKANPRDKAGRLRISQVVFEQGQKLDTGTTRERAVSLYEQAIQFRGEVPPPAWTVRLAAVRKAVAREYYENGMRAFRGNLDTAIRNWETCLKYEPGHVNCSLRLQEARSFQKQLKRVGEATGRKQ